MFPSKKTIESQREDAGKRGRPERATEVQGTRPREVSQVSSGPSRSQGRQDVGGVRRWAAAPSGSGQQPRSPARQREISQAQLSIPEPSGSAQKPTSAARRPPFTGNVGSARRTREISQVSAYSVPTGPPEQPQGSRRPQSVGAIRRRPNRSRDTNEPSMSSPYGQPSFNPYGQPPINPYQYPPRRQRGIGGTTRPPYQDPSRLPYQDPSMFPSRPREIGGVPGNNPYYPTRPTRFPRRRRPPPSPYVEPQRPWEYTDPFGGNIGQYPPQQQPPMETSQPGGSYPPFTYEQWDRLFPYLDTYPDLYQPPISVQDTGVQHDGDLDTDEPKQPSPPPPPRPSPPKVTAKGLRELSCGQGWLIVLLWLPRIFIPWITAWHSFNLFALSNPWHWKDRENELQNQRLYVIVGRSIIAIISSVFVDEIRRKCELQYYVYLVFLVLFTLSPVSAANVVVLLRAQFFDDQTYKDWWFSSVVLTQWVFSTAFIMFPVQMACIYSQNDVMPRYAHYTWTSLFVLLEFASAYAAFWIIPGTCPSKEWSQLAAWAGIGLLMVTVTMMTLILLFAVGELRDAMLMCWTKPSEEDEVPYNNIFETFIDPGPNLKCKKLAMFSMIALPIISASFSVAVLERFVPYDDWDDHRFLSSLGTFLIWKIIGVIMMALLMFVVYKVKMKKSPNSRPNMKKSLRTEILYLGIPHILCIFALTTLVGRLTTLSHLKEGDIVVGPIPDKDKTVLVFVNSMFRNRTICIRSHYFEPVAIRPNQHVTRELLHDIGVDSFTVTMEVDPCSEPAIRTRTQIDNIRKGEWKVYDVVLLSSNLTDLNTWDFYRTLYAYSLRGEGDLRPRVGLPQIVIFQVSSVAPPEDWYYQMNHTEAGSWAVRPNNSVWGNLGFSRNLILWDVPATGMWTVKLWSNLYNKSDAAYAWATNCTQCVSPLVFEVENNSLYLLVEYYYEEFENFALNFSYFDDPPPDLQFPMYPMSYALFKLGEVAGPNSNRLPNKEELHKDQFIKVSMALAGMAAGGIFLGFVYLFWVDPPVPVHRTTILAVCWVLMGIAADIPRLMRIEISVNVSIMLLSVQIVMTALHFIAAGFMHTPKYDFRNAVRSGDPNLDLELYLRETGQK